MCVCVHVLTCVHVCSRVCAFAHVCMCVCGRSRGQAWKQAEERDFIPRAMGSQSRCVKTYHCSEPEAWGGNLGGDQYPRGREEPESDLKDSDKSDLEGEWPGLGWKKTSASVGSWHIRQIEFHSILAPDSLCNLNCSVPQLPHL